MNRKNTPCANLNITGCDGYVNRRGNVLCEKCLKQREEKSKSKKEENERSLLQRTANMERRLKDMKSEYENKLQEYSDLVLNLEAEKQDLANEIDTLSDQYDERLSQLSSEKDRSEENLESEIETLQKQFKDEIKEAKLRAKILQLKNEDLEILHEESQERLSKCQKASRLADTYFQQMKKLEKENNELKEQIKELKTTCVNTSKENSIISEKYNIEKNTLEKEVEKLEDELKILRKGRERSRSRSKSKEQSSKEKGSNVRSRRPSVKIPRLKRLHSNGGNPKKVPPTSIKMEDKDYKVERFKQSVENRLPKSTIEEENAEKKNF